MPDYDASIEFAASPEAVFDYLSDVGNLPHYFDRMTSAAPGEGEEVVVSADLDGREVEGRAWFRVDRESLSLSWGAEGPHDYHGRLVVSERGLGARVAVTLSTERAAGPEIQDGLERTLANVRRLTEPA